MNQAFYATIESTLNDITTQKLLKQERIITSPQSPEVILANGKTLLNFCANNYLGLADDKALITAAKDGLDHYGYGMASVRFICGTQSIHKTLEKSISDFLGFEDTILYSSCFDANGGVFEPLLSENDAIISDELNHASIIDGIRLCKAKRFRYKNNDPQDLKAKLEEATQANARFKLIVTDGVFSMDGIIANLRAICDLADQYDALVMVDDSHAAGFIGQHGRGTPEFCGVEGRIDIMTGTLGKGLGGAAGGYTSGRRSLIELLRNRSRPYLFSNSLVPVITAASIKAIETVKAADDLRTQLMRNQRLFRTGLTQAGFDLIPGQHPIIPVMLYDEGLAVAFAEGLLKHNIYVIPFSYPVVPKGKARIRTQMSAKHTESQIKQAIEAFTAVGEELGVLTS